MLAHALSLLYNRGMNEKVLSTLEYHKITAMLLEKAQTPIGQETIRNLTPSGSLPDNVDILGISNCRGNGILTPSFLTLYPG